MSKKMAKKIILILSLLALGAQASKKDSLAKDSSTSKALQFNTRDIIKCKLWGPAKHIMLATSSSTVAHMWGLPDPGRWYEGKGVLKEQNWEDVAQYFDSCWVGAKASSSIRSDAIDRARRDINRHGGNRIYYHLLGCNCEHWVNYWAYNSYYSYQSAWWTYKACDVGK